MTDNIPKICAAFEMWQDNDCIQAGTTLELIMRYLADDPEIDYQVADVDRDGVVQDYIGRQNENLNAKTLIIRELNKKIAQAKTEQLIDEDCIGCAGPCMVVDVAAELQKELDMCHQTIKTFKILETRETDRLNKTIEQYKDENVSLRVTINDMAKSWSDDRATIEDLNSQLTDERAIIDKITLLRVNEVETRQGLEAELSALKDDSAVLMKVVEIVKNWDDSTGRAFPTLIKILDELVDYTNVLKGPPIDGETCVFCGRKNPSLICGTDWYCDMRCVDGQADVNKRDESPEITVTVAFLELP